jgi:biotin carboxyl carrier protein
MRKFSITVNGQAFDVEVEEIGGAPVFAPAPAAAAPVFTPAAAPVAPAPTPTAAAATPAAGEPVQSPMPGTILDVKVSVGQAVKKGDVLAVLEAMKMENEILAARDAVVAGISVAKGSTVNAGDTLVTLG